MDPTDAPREADPTEYLKYVFEDTPHDCTYKGCTNPATGAKGNLYKKLYRTA